MRVRDRKRQVRKAVRLWRKRHPEAYAACNKRGPLAAELRHAGMDPIAARAAAKEAFP